MKRCPFCAEEIQDEAIVCKHCGRDLARPTSEQAPAASSRGRQLGLIGAALLAVGVFTPIVRLPIVGSINYFSNGNGDGTIILVIAALAALLATIRRPGWLLPCGAASLGLLTVVALSLRERMAEAQSSMARDLADNPFRGIAAAMTQSTQLEWGWAVMIAGAALLIVAAFIDRKRPSWLAIGSAGLVIVAVAVFAYVQLDSIPFL